MMTDTLQRGTGRKAAIAGWQAAGKTGTTNDSRDAWFIGYTANLTTGVWFGNDDGKPTKDVTGGSLPAMAWNEFMAAAHKGVPMRALLTNWQAPGQQPNLIDRILSSDAGGEAVAPAAVPQASGQPVALPSDRPAEPVPMAGVRRPPAAIDQTSSIRRPQADIGGAPQKKPGSIMDVILGN
jgi:penicillin-binding protein 1A